MGLSSQEKIYYEEIIRGILEDSDEPLSISEIIKFIIYGNLSHNNDVESIVSNILSDDSSKWFDKVLYSELPGNREDKYIRKYRKYDGHIFSMTREAFEEYGYFSGIITDQNQIQNYYPRVFLDSSTEKSGYYYRDSVERDCGYKQVVSYVIVKSGNKLLTYRRGSKSSVDLKNNPYAIGFGGHMEFEGMDELFGLDSDELQESPGFSLWQAYRRSILRELQEEIGYQRTNLSQLSLLGVMNDSSVKQGQKHLVFIHELNVSGTTIEDFNRKLEYFKITDLSLTPIRNIFKKFRDYEYWTKLCLMTFFREELGFDCYKDIATSIEEVKSANAIAIVGHSGVGKSSACEILANRYGYHVVRCSRIMQSVIGCEPIEVIGRKGLQDAGYAFVNNGGHEELSQAIVNYMDQFPNERFILDGLRYPETLNVISKKLGGYKIPKIYIDTNADELYKRFMAKNKEDLGFAEYLKILFHPVERDIPRFARFCDINIYNYGSREAFTKVIENIFEENK